MLQPDAAEGRRSHRLPPQERAALPARTQALEGAGLGGRAAARGRNRSSSSCRRVSAEGASEEAPGTPVPSQEPEAAPVAQPAAAAKAEGESWISGGAARAAPAQQPATASDSPSSGPLPPPLPVAPGAARLAASSGQGKQEGVEAPAAAVPSVPAVTAPAAAAQEEPGSAVYSGVPAEVEAAALPQGPGVPAWLAQQGCRNESVSGAAFVGGSEAALGWLCTPAQAPPRIRFVPPLSQGTCLGSGPVLMTAQEAAAAWRLQWLAGLQWHNAWRAWQPVRAGSSTCFIPLDPNDRVLDVRLPGPARRRYPHRPAACCPPPPTRLPPPASAPLPPLTSPSHCRRRRPLCVPPQVLIHSSAVMPEHVVAGGARFLDMVFSDACLHSLATGSGLIRCARWGLPLGDGTVEVSAGVCGAALGWGCSPHAALCLLAVSSHPAAHHAHCTHPRFPAHTAGGGWPGAAAAPALPRR